VAGRLIQKTAAGYLPLLVSLMAAVLLVAAGAATCAHEPAQRAVSAPFTAPGATNEQRAAFIVSCGWEINTQPSGREEVTIPLKFGAVYAEYNELQKKQGFDLEPFRGKTAVRWSYEVLNYPGVPLGVRADVLVCRGRIIAGDIAASALDGFMQELRG
jgi:hypothetical protein